MLKKMTYEYQFYIPDVGKSQKENSFVCRHAKDDEPFEIKIFIVDSHITMGQN
jgi:hypothetical protein